MRNALFLCVWVIGSCTLAECTTAAKTDLYAQNSAKYEAMVGKDYWIKPLLTLPTCTEPVEFGDCQTLRAPLHLKIDGIAQGYVKGTFTKTMLNDPFFHVVLDDGRQVYTNAAIASGTFSDLDPSAVTAAAAEECKRRGDPRIGMTVKQLEATCWGKPEHITRRQTARGVRDHYVYGKNRYVDLHDGIVTSIDQGGMNERRAH